MKLLIKSAKIIDPSSPYHNTIVDIFISEGTIKEIGTNLNINNVEREIELEDLHVSRGWFDSSVCFGEPGFEERETIKNGLDTAALSGFTAIALNSNTDPVIDNNGAVTSLLSKADKHPVKMYPIGALTKKSRGKELAELYDMQQAGAVAFGDYKKAVKHPNMLKLALQYTQNFEGLVQSFPQDDDLAGKGLVNEDTNSTQLGLKGIPPLAEEVQVLRDLAILEYTGGKLHIPTISTAKSVKLIKEAKKKGFNVTCSVAIHNLVFSDDHLLDFDTNAKVLPPLRSNSQIKELFKGLKDGTIDMVTSDHTPIDTENKKIEFENALFGTIGLESAFGTLLSISDLEETINWLTKGRSRFGIASHKIEAGNPADLTLFTPKGKEKFTKNNIYSTSKNSLFLNSELMGKVYGVVSGRQIKLQNDH